MTKQMIKLKIRDWFKQHEFLPAVLVLMAVALVFLWPLFLYQGYYAPGDVIRKMSPFVNGVQPHNYLLTDVVQQFLPWFKLSSSLIRQGHWPLWNIYSGGGLPLLANMQSAVLFPVTWLFYLLPFKLALGLSAFLKLLLVGVFTWLYLRQLKINRWLALAGASAFMTCGYMVVWLMWPHTNVVFALPAGLYFIERWFVTKNSRDGLWLSLVLMLGVFGGHPETMFYVGLVWVVYSLVRLIQAKTKIIKRGFALAGYLLLGALLSAVAWLPFLEYLKHSAIWLSRNAPQGNDFHLPGLMIIANWLPDIFGNQAIRGFYFNKVLNYNETTAGYVGVLLAVAGLYALIWHWRDKTIALFAGLLVFSLAVVYKVPLIFEAVTALPGFSSSTNHRLLLIMAFSVVVIGCLGLQYLIEDKNSKRRLLGVGTGWLVLMVVLFAANYRRLEALVSAAKWPEVNLWLWSVLALFVAAMVLSVVVLINSRWRFSGLLIFLIVFIETVVHGSVYNRVTAEADFYPQVGAVSYLQQAFARDQQRVLMLNGVLPPNLGTWYGFNQLNEYDAMGLESFQQLKKQVGNFESTWERLNGPFNWPLAQFLGAAYVVAPASRASELLSQRPNQLSEVYRDDRVVVLRQAALPRAYWLADSDLTALPESLVVKVLASSNKIENYQLAENGAEMLVYQSDQSGWLIFNENYYPGWVARLDGEVININSWRGLRSLAVPAGKHQVEIVYEPKSFRIGLGLSAFGVVIWLGWWFLSKAKYDNKQ